MCLCTLPELVSWSFVKRTFLEFAFVFGFHTVCNAVLAMEKPLEVLLMPGLAFDRQGHRLGRGGGYASVYVLTRILQPQEFCSHLTFVLTSSCLSNCSVCVLSVCLPLCLSVCLSTCLCTVCLYVGCLFVCLSVYFMSVFWLSVSLSVFLSVSGSLLLSILCCLSPCVCVHTLVVCYTYLAQPSKLPSMQTVRY